MNASLVEARDLVAHYGSSQVLFGVGLDLRRGEFVTLLGRNGMGKSTLVKVLLGMLPAHGGSVRFEGTEISDRPDHENARRGIGLVPEGPPFTNVPELFSTKSFSPSPSLSATVGLVAGRGAVG